MFTFFKTLQGSRSEYRRLYDCTSVSVWIETLAA
jgi:hypothetical protein